MQRPHSIFLPTRFYFLLGLIALVVCCLGIRIIDLAIYDQQFLRNAGDERALRFIETPSLRGMIVDRNGKPLAISTTVYSVWINPREIEGNLQPNKKLASLLGVRLSILQHFVRKNKSRSFIYLKRGISPTIARAIKDLQVPGVYLQPGFHRYYPEGEVTGHVLGFTNIDDHGQEGLELAYNDWLQGSPGKKWVIKDRLGRIIEDAQTLAMEQPGQDLILSVDSRIQYIAYQALLDGITASHAKSGSVVVLDVETGEILALTNQPTFNPNNRSSLLSENFRNRAVTDTFEPGSTIKAFTVASALASKRFNVNSIIDTSPGWMRLDHDIVKDERNNGKLSLAQILQHSSNMGAAKLVLGIPPNELWILLRRIGFGEISGAGFPGEQEGNLYRPDKWGAFPLATLSFGYGLSVTALQLARAYAVLGNDGVKLPLSILKLDAPASGDRIMDAEVAKEMLSLLETVVQKGSTNQAARVSGYRVAGKSGTSKIVGTTGYEKHRYTASFVGIAPLTHPRLVVAVIVHDPQGKQYYGGKVAGPIFSNIMQNSLRLLNVAPDAHA